MSLVGRPALNHPQQTQARAHMSGNDRRWHSTDEIDDREITDEDWAPIHARFGFTVAAAAAPHNAKLPRYWTRDDDALAQPWTGEMVWCNPPYSDIEPWVSKAWDEHPTTGGIVMLLPANRTEQGWWQRLVEPYRDQPGSPLTVEFLRGRMRFLRPGALAIGPNERPPFGCLLAVWHAPIRPARPAHDRGADVTTPEPRTVDPDDLRAWHTALPAHIARAVTLDYITIPALRQALEHETPAELARICRVGITRHTVNIRGLVLYRIRRTAGLLNDQEADT